MVGGHVTTGMGRQRDAQGMTLLEIMIAAAVLVTVSAGLLGLFATAIEQNETQGDSAARTTEYAQDKMEQLMKLSFSDTATDTRVFPVAASGGTGLGGSAVNTTYGSVPSSPVPPPPEACTVGYVDYLDQSGNLLTSYGTCGATPVPPSSAFYTREWSIATDSTGTLKTITVVVTAKPLRKGGVVPSTGLVSVKSGGF
jgi:Tfp pilus assembly protein PilV